MKGTPFQWTGRMTEHSTPLTPKMRHYPTNKVGTLFTSMVEMGEFCTVLKLLYFYLCKIWDPIISSDYRVYGTQNDRLEPTVSTQKLALKNMHRVLRYWQNLRHFLNFSWKAKFGYILPISQDSVHIFQNRFLWLRYVIDMPEPYLRYSWKIPNIYMWYIRST